MGPQHLKLAKSLSAVGVKSIPESLLDFRCLSTVYVRYYEFLHGGSRHA